MRPARQLKVITSQLEVLEDMKIQFESLLATINNILQKGFKWIDDDTNELSFIELNQLLTNGTSECLTKCLIIANGSDESSQNITKQTESKEPVLLSTSCSCFHSKEDSDFHKLKEEISEIEKSHLKKFKIVNQKLASLEKETTETILKDIDTRNSLKFKEIMKEFHSASDFMSRLQSQNEILANSVKETTIEINDMRQTFNDIKAQSITTSNINSSDAQTYEELSLKVSDNTKLIEAVQSLNESLSSKLNAVECNFNSLSTEVDSIKRSAVDIDATKTTKLPVEQALIDASEKSVGYFPVYHGEPDENEGEDDDDDDYLDDVAVGFDACVSEESATFDLVKNEILTCFTSVTEDIQANFDPESGIFTVPCDGLYLCGLFIDIITFVQHDLEFCINLRETDGTETVIAHCHCRQRNTTVSDVAIKHLRENDEVFVSSNHSCKKLKLSNYSHFMCTLIKEYSS